MKIWLQNWSQRENLAPAVYSHQTSPLAASRHRAGFVRLVSGFQKTYGYSYVFMFSVSSREGANTLAMTPGLLPLAVWVAQQGSEFQHWLSRISALVIPFSFSTGDSGHPNSQVSRGYLVSVIRAVSVIAGRSQVQGNPASEQFQLAHG